MKLNFNNEKVEGRRDTLENCGCCNEYKLFNTKQNKKKAGRKWSVRRQVLGILNLMQEKKLDPLEGCKDNLRNV